MAGSRSAILVAADGLDVAAAYASEREFVARSLGRLGVARSEVEDLSQEVYAVVARRRRDFDAAQALRPWLWGICVGVVRNARRARRRKPTVPWDETVPTSLGPGATPLEIADARRRLRRAEEVLEAMDVERRAVFVMYEIEGMSGEAIAAAMGIPAGTVHSRLFAARKGIAAALRDEDAIEGERV